MGPIKLPATLDNKSVIVDPIPAKGGIINLAAKLCLDEIRMIQSEGPYRILSYSIGNVVAFEVAKQLIQAGEQVNLVMIDPPLFFDKSRTFGKGGY